ncbi:MAG: hypothetical protein R3E62_05910 [Pseudomonadales bacterium]
MTPVKRFLITLFGLLAGCTSTSGYLLTWYADKNPTPKQFDLCHGYSCRYKASVSLPDATWQKITLLFAEENLSAEQERQHIAQAISLLEQQAGEISGISTDLPKSPNFKDPYGQQDCIDETVNTSTYLKMLQADHLLRWHRISPPARRGYLVDGRWPHNTATIEALSSGERYAVDSWPGANSQAPEIKRLSAWYQEGRH